MKGRTGGGKILYNKATPGKKRREEERETMKYVCSRCGKEEDAATRKPRCECGGLWNLEFERPKFSLDLVDRDEWSIFRYRAFMPPLGGAWRAVSLGEGLTPVVRFDDDLSLKMDYFMPTLSFKDRGAAVLVSHCRAVGVESVAQDSSGNAGNSVAAYCARAGIACEIFVPEGTSPKKIDMIRAHGAAANVIPGSRDHCADVCRAAVRERGLYYANHVYNPFFYEGTKTYLYEIYEQLGRVPRNIFVPVGNGTLYLGVVKALEEFLAVGLIAGMPNVVLMQSENCAPLLEAWRSGDTEPARIDPRPTLAEGIAIGRPMRGEAILASVRKYDFKIVAVPEDAILACRRELAAKGIYCEHTTAANYAGYRRYCELYGRTPDSVIPMCGAGLKSDH